MRIKDQGNYKIKSRFIYREIILLSLMTGIRLFSLHIRVNNSYETVVFEFKFLLQKKNLSGESWKSLGQPDSILKIT